MRLLKFLMFIPTLIVKGGSLTCEDKCIKKEKMIEDLDMCRYVFHKFPKRSSLPPIHYKDLYSNDSQTTLYSLKKEFENCTDKLARMVFETIVYFLF